MKHLLKFGTILSLTLLITACSKDDEDQADPLITPEEGTEIIESAITSRSGGLTTELEAASDLAIEYADQGVCGQMGDTIFTFNGSNAFASYAYTNNIGWLLSCNGLGIPQQLDLGSNAAGSFESMRWEGQSTGQGAMVATGLQVQAPAIIINGTYDYDATLTGNLRNTDPVLTTTIDAQLADITVDKTTKEITGGSGTFTLTVRNGKGNETTVEGSIVFNGDGTATVTINGYSRTFPI